MRKIMTAILMVLLVWTLSSGAVAQVKIKIVNMDGPGEGFNDPTPAAPIAGNKGKTIGDQRLIAFNYAANVWGKVLPPIGDFQIRIAANFDPLACTANSAVLGSAGTITVWSDFPGAIYPNTWYQSALANKLAGYDLLAGPKIDPRYPDLQIINDDLQARFNSNLGKPGCLTGSYFYYGLDTKTPPGMVNLVTVLLHEFAHGLGFANFVNEATGAEFNGMDDVYSKFTRDNTTGLTWDVMTDAQRQAAAVNTGNEVWIGSHAVAAVPSVLGGLPQLVVNSPPGIAGTYAVGQAGFGGAVKAPGVTANVVQALDPDGSATDGCSPFSNAAAVAGNIAIVDRGTCTFIIKAKNAQNAGAVGVIVSMIAPGPPIGLGGCDGSITIPVVSISQTDGATIKANLPGVNATIGAGAVTSGTDFAGNPLLYAPNPVEMGSSISHWDVSAYPNQLMEPAINCNLSHSVVVPQDLTFEQLKDVGW